MNVCDVTMNPCNIAQSLLQDLSNGNLISTTRIRH